MPRQPKQNKQAKPKKRSSVNKRPKIVHFWPQSLKPSRRKLASDSRGASGWVSLLILLVAITGGVLAVQNVQNLRDWAALRGYNAPAEIAALAEETTMNDATRRIFY